MHVTIVGCGQLARMLALAGWQMNIRFSFIAEPGESVRGVTGLGKVVVRRDNETAVELYHRLGRPDVITVEREHVDIPLLRQLQVLCPVYPDPATIAVTGDRLQEKRALQKHGLPHAAFVACEQPAQLPQAAATLGLPLFVKSCRQGYDGKNQWRIRDPQQLQQLASQLPAQSLVAEAAVPFVAEASLLGVRSASGETAFYPLAENQHCNGILVSSSVPSSLSPLWQQQARDWLGQLLQQWQYVGVLAMELFVTEQGLLVNELAPRVHNSGHWTHKGAATCQFENHLRAILGLPLGDTSLHRPCAIINLLGRPVNARQLVQKNSWLADYNKSVRKGRKLGHVTLLADRPEQLAGQRDAVLGACHPE